MRHGETVWNVEGRLQGALDSPLTDKGREQAARQARLLMAALASVPIYSSPQGRSLDTARIIGAQFGQDVMQDAALREVSMGDWDGKLVADVAPINPKDALLWKFDAPGGDRLEGFRARILAFVTALTSPAILVTHGVTSRVLRGALLGVPDDELVKLPGGQGVVFHLKDGVQTCLE
nr:histidine phosphatase family protein [Cognatishimia sp. MH4019]